MPTPIPTPLPQSDNKTVLESLRQEFLESAEKMAEYQQKAHEKSFQLKTLANQVSDLEKELTIKKESMAAINAQVEGYRSASTSLKSKIDGLTIRILKLDSPTNIADVQRSLFTELSKKLNKSNNQAQSTPPASSATVPANGRTPVLQYPANGRPVISRISSNSEPPSQQPENSDGYRSKAFNSLAVLKRLNELKGEMNNSKQQDDQGK